MTTVWIQEQLHPNELEHLKKEFPLFSFSIDEDQSLEEVEVLFGSNLSAQELEKGDLLRWIHLPTSDVSCIPIQTIQKRGNILITYTPEVGLNHHAEWAIASFLAFKKNLFSLKDSLSNLFDIGRVEGETWVEAVLEKGKNLTTSLLAKKMGLKVVGCNLKGSFVPHVDRVYPWRKLISTFPKGGAISFSTESTFPKAYRLGENEIERIDRETILILSTNKDRIDEEPIKQRILDNSIRGVCLDTSDETLFNSFKSLQGHPRLLLTPKVSSLPILPSSAPFNLFKQLIRDYLCENFVDMNPKWE